MQGIEPNMDELMRKASEGYPLKPGEDNWNKIASKLSGETGQKGLVKSPNHKKYYATVLILLLLISVTIPFFIFNGKQNNLINTNGSQRTLAQQYPTVSKIYPVQPKGISSGATRQKDFLMADNDHVDIVQKDHSAVSTAGSADVKNKNHVIIETRNKAKSKIIIKEDVLADPLVRYTIPTKSKNRVSKLISVHLQRISNTPLKTSEFSIQPYGSMQLFSPLTSGTIRQKVNTSPSLRGLYYGLIVGPGFNAVKAQGLRKTGFDIGFLAGYRINAKLNVETGLVFAQKYYTTAGKYFSKKEIEPMMQGGKQVTQVQGSSSIFEIPIHLRYYLANKNNHRFFSSAGFSSYIITTESNKYFTSLNGAEEKLYGFYQTDRRYFVAAIDLGVGYEQSLGRKNNIRFEPYIQIPIKGIGIGNLPITGTGLHIGITRSVLH